MKQAIKNALPRPAWTALRWSYSTLMHMPELPGAYLHAWRRESIRRLGAFRDVHKGQRAFIIGNGPSLKQMDLSKLKGEFTFGLNRIYLMFPELGFPTSYLVSINDLVIEQCAEEIAALPIPKFLSWHSHRFFTGRSFKAGLPTFLYTTYDNPVFAKDARYRLWEGATVTCVALQLAFHMGFEEVILIGVDHNFTTQGPANTTITSQGDDPNHFDTRYFGKGFRWQLPDLQTSEIGYALARQAYEGAGRRLLDATVGGKLTIFPKTDYNSLF